MAIIDPNCLRNLRRSRKLTRGDLAERSRVSARTIQRLEDARQGGKGARENTLHKLAKALRVESGVLTGELPPPDAGKARAPDPERVQLGALVMPDVRLAYDLAKRRYGVSAAEIISMAPLFFVLLAEQSLAWRREKLGEACEAVDRLDQIKDEAGYRIFPGLAADALQKVELEAESIAKADLFGKVIDDGGRFAEPFEPSELNPFAGYLCKLAGDLDKRGTVDADRDFIRFGSPPKFPVYSICHDDLVGITNGSERADVTLQFGGARITEIPEELMAEDAGEKRAKWLEDRLPKIVERHDALPGETAEPTEDLYKGLAGQLYEDLSGGEDVPESAGLIERYGSARPEASPRGRDIDGEGDIQ